MQVTHSYDRKKVYKRVFEKTMTTMTQELESLISDYGGGRKKSTEKSQLFNDISNEVLIHFNNKSYKEIEQFCEYLKEISKITSVYKFYGVEQSIDQKS